MECSCLTLLVLASSPCIILADQVVGSDENVDDAISASAWRKGIILSVIATIIGGASKLAIRKSWIVQKEIEENQDQAQAECEEAIDETNTEAKENEAQHNMIEIGNESTDDAELANMSGLGPFFEADEDEDDFEDDLGDEYSHVSSLLPQRYRLTSHDTQDRLFYSGSTPVVDVGDNENDYMTKDVPKAFDLSSSMLTNSDGILYSNYRKNTGSTHSGSLSVASSITDDSVHSSTHSKKSCRSCSSGSRRTRYDPQSRLPRQQSLVNELQIKLSLSFTKLMSIFLNTVWRFSQLPMLTSGPLFVPRLLRFSGMIGMTFLNPLCGVMAMNYVSPSISAPFSGLTMVWILLLSGPLLKEYPTPRQIVSAMLIMIGEVFVAIFGDHTNGDEEAIQNEGSFLSVTESNNVVNGVYHSYLDGPFSVYLAGLTVWLFFLGYWIYSVESSPNKEGTWMSIQRATLHRFSWGVAGGSLTGLQNFLKDALIVVKAIKSRHHDVDSVTTTTQHVPWLFLTFLLLMAVGAAFGGLLLLAACMKRFDATYSAAMFIGSYVISASIMSAVHYNTFQHLKGLDNYIFYPFGLVILMSGVYLLVLESSEEVDVHSRVQVPDAEPQLTVPEEQIMEHNEKSSNLSIS